MCDRVVVTLCLKTEKIQRGGKKERRKDISRTLAIPSSSNWNSLCSIASLNLHYLSIPPARPRHPCWGWGQHFPRLEGHWLQANSCTPRPGLRFGVWYVKSASVVVAAPLLAIEPHWTETIHSDAHAGEGTWFFRDCLLLRCTHAHARCHSFNERKLEYRQ